MTTEITLAEYWAHAKRPLKYGNTPTEIDGWKFDSIAEAERYKELRILETAGRIEDLTCHPTYELQGPFRDGGGKRHAAIIYEADFCYTEFGDGLPQNGQEVVEDVKGKRTAVFEIKRKLFLARYPHLQLRILEV